MKESLTVVFAILCLAAASIGLSQTAASSEQVPQASRSAGSFTSAITGSDAYDQPAAVLEKIQWYRFIAGRAVFRRQWQSTAAENGETALGPIYVAGSCATCHINTGRGHPPESSTEQLLSMLVRVSLPGKDEHAGVVPHPQYGTQLQNRVVSNRNSRPPEADLYLDWQEEEVSFIDGDTARLRKPALRTENLAYAPLDNTLTSLRAAPPLIGIGLLDAVADETILALAQEQRERGFSGRPNYVWDAVNARIALGRYGWKAGVGNLRQQVAAAASGDMGLSSRLYPTPDCPPVSRSECALISANQVPELGDGEIDSLTSWLHGLAVPARRDTSDPQVKRGEQIFTQAQCSVCHVSRLVTARTYPPLPQLANQTIRAYTDLLLHDMGDGLADGRPEFEAGSRDWRTPPLWGLGLSRTVTGKTTLLHDGRARNVTEAILWHGGEAAPSREKFRAMSRPDREALVRFVESI